MDVGGLEAHEGIRVARGPVRVRADRRQMGEVDPSGQAALLHLDRRHQVEPQQGEVVAVGPGARNEDGKIIPVDVKKGDRVLFGKWSGTEVKIDGEELLIMKESDILGVIEGKASVRAAA